MRKILGVYSSSARPIGSATVSRFARCFPTTATGSTSARSCCSTTPARRSFEPTDAPRGVGEHPHRGFETVTIVYQGEVEHRDSTGSGGKIGPGDVQWMTAASGILHEEFHSRELHAQAAARFEMVQLWVNLPAKDKMATPGYQTLLDGDIPVVALAGRRRHAARHRRRASTGHKGPARTFTPIDVWDLRLNAGKTARR